MVCNYVFPHLICTFHPLALCAAYRRKISAKSTLFKAPQAMLWVISVTRQKSHRIFTSNATSR